MRRYVALTALACLLSSAAFAGQAPPPVQKSKYIPPVKGLATLEVIQAPPKRVGKDMVTVAKIRNTSKGSINLLTVDEYWYDANLKIVGAGTYAHRKAPMQPGEVIATVHRWDGGAPHLHMEVWRSGAGGYRHYVKHQQRGDREMPCAIALGCPPYLAFVAPQKLPIDVDEVGGVEATRRRQETETAAAAATQSPAATHTPTPPAPGHKPPHHGRPGDTPGRTPPDPRPAPAP